MRNFLGTPSPDGSCKFTYRSSSRKDGRFNSPRHPSNYPSNTDCYYEFYAMPHEQVQIVFDNFKVRTDNLKQDQSLGNKDLISRNFCCPAIFTHFFIKRNRGLGCLWKIPMCGRLVGNLSNLPRSY